MATLRDTLRTTAEADATLMATLTGGLFDASELDYDGLSMASIPRESDGVTIKPFGVIRWRGGNRLETGSNDFYADSETVEIYLYAPVGYSSIESAMRRIRQVFDNRYLSADNRDMAHIRVMFNSGELPQDKLQMVACRFVRLQIIST